MDEIWRHIRVHCNKLTALDNERRGDAKSSKEKSKYAHSEVFRQL